MSINIIIQIQIKIINFIDKFKKYFKIKKNPYERDYNDNIEKCKINKFYIGHLNNYFIILNSKKRKKHYKKYPSFLDSINEEDTETYTY
jgi:hypothetical protein